MKREHKLQLRAWAIRAGYTPQASYLNGPEGVHGYMKDGQWWSEEDDALLSHIAVTLHRMVMDFAARGHVALVADYVGLLTERGGFSGTADGQRDALMWCWNTPSVIAEAASMVLEGQTP